MSGFHSVELGPVVEELNPGLTYRIGRSIPAGDPYCEHIIETRPGGRGRQPGIEPAS